MKSIERYTPKTLERVWGQEIFFIETNKYVGKILKMKAGTAGGLQMHVEKDEGFFLLEGKALVTYDDGTGNLIKVEMVPGEAYHIPPGATHKVLAVTDVVMLEASTPHYDDRIRVEREYGLPIPDGELELETTWVWNGSKYIRKVTK